MIVTLSFISEDRLVDICKRYEIWGCFMVCCQIISLIMSATLKEIVYHLFVKKLLESLQHNSILMYVYYVNQLN